MHPPLSEQDVLATGGWHPRYVRVLATASDGDYGVAIVDGNGDGAELEEEAWLWDDADGRWTGGSSSGAGALDDLAAIQTGGQVGDSCYAYGRATARSSVRLSFGGQTFQVPVGPHGVWAFIGTGSGPPPALAT